MAVSKNANSSRSIVGFYRKVLLVVTVITSTFLVLIITLDTMSVIDMSSSRWTRWQSASTPRPTAFSFISVEDLRRNTTWKSLSTIHLLKSPKNVSSLRELGEIVRHALDLETSMAIYRSHIDVKDMKFDQNFWPPGVAPNGEYRKEYDRLFYTMTPQNRCALIGSSGILLNSSCGKEIDAHDIVMRSNLPPVAGFENDVGSKTDIIAMSHLVSGYISKYYKKSLSARQTSSSRRYVEELQNLNNTLLWFPFNSSWQAQPMRGAVGRLQHFLDVTKGKFKMNFRVGYAPVPLYPHLIHKVWHNRQTSEGFVLFTIATMFCKEINLYGYWPFWQDRHGNNITHHYFENRTFHSKIISNEFKTLKEFDKRGVIKLNSDRCL